MNESRSIELDEQEPAPSGQMLPPERPYDPARARERMRGVIAVLLLLFLAAVIVAGFVTLWLDLAAIEELDTLLTITFAPLVGLVGAVTGFYYGARAAG
jgi:hypothetical protein